MDTTLVLVGVACIIGAIVGGGVKLVQVELSPVASLWRQLMLGGFGMVLVLSGLVAGGRISLTGGKDVAPPDMAKDGSTALVEPDARHEPGVRSSPSAEATIVSTSLATPSPDEARPVFEPTRGDLPSKVDIFWCAGDQGDANAEVAERIAPTLNATAEIARVRVRPLGQATNAGASYRIFRRIVRYDPGERAAAEQIARLASDAGGVTFRAEPALPGSPSIDYLSVFVCTSGRTRA